MIYSNKKASKERIKMERLPSFAKPESPLLAAVIRQRTVKEAIAAVTNAQYHGATGIDLHLSCLDDEYKNPKSIEEILKFCKIPVMALNYNHRIDYSTYQSTEEDRIALLMMAVEAGVSCIDLQGYSYDLESKDGFRQEYQSLGYSFTKGNPKEIVCDEAIIEKQTRLIEDCHNVGCEVLLSCHPGVYMNTQQACELAKFLEKRNPDVIKLVCPCGCDEQLSESFGTMIALRKAVDCKVSFHLNGPMGKLSRIINPVLGGHLIFSIDGYTVSDSPEQLDLATAKKALDALTLIK